MIGRRLIRTMATAALVTGVLAAGEVRAQAPLGFTIDPTQGVPGTVVTGQVDPADVAESCVTDLAEFQARFDDLVNDVLAFFAPDPLWLRFFPADVMDILTTVETHDQLAYTLTLLVAFGIAINEGGAAEAALTQTFVMTFADLATQDPVGELGSFDPVTGVGSVMTPDVACGPWPVVATCVGPTFDRDALEAGIRSSGAFLEEIGAPAVSPIAPEFEAWAQGYLGSMNTGFDLLIEFATAVGPTLIQNIVEFDALGLQIFNVLCQPTERINDLIADIEALVASGQLKANKARALTRRLTSVLRKLDQGKLGRPVCAKLESFVKVVNARVKAKALSETAAAALIAEAESIAEQLGCDEGGSPSGAFLQ